MCHWFAKKTAEIYGKLFILGKRSNIKGGRQEEFIGSLIGFGAHILAKTLRFEIDIHPEVNLNDASIFCFWHNRTMMAPEIWQRSSASAKLCCLTSASRDGTTTAAMMSMYGITSVRGSSSRRGKQAMIEMIRTLRSGTSLAITPDGPRGPRYKMDRGLIKLAAKTQIPIVPTTINYSSYWQLKTWDQFRIPKPFSKVEFTMLKPTIVDRNVNDIGVWDIKQQLEKLMGQEAS